MFSTLRDTDVAPGSGRVQESQRISERHNLRVHKHHGQFESTDVNNCSSSSKAQS
jgi:hypothetical protein